MNSLRSPDRRPYALSNARTSVARIPASRRMLPRGSAAPASPAISNFAGTDGADDDDDDDDDAGHGSGSIVLRAAAPFSTTPSSPARSFPPHTPLSSAAASVFARAYGPHTPVSPAPPYSPPRPTTVAPPPVIVHHHPAARSPRSYAPQLELAASPACAYRGPLAAADVLRLLTQPLSKNARRSLTTRAEGYLLYFHFLGFADSASLSSPSERWRCRLCGLELSTPAKKISNLGTHLYGGKGRVSCAEIRGACPAEDVPPFSFDTAGRIVRQTHNGKRKARSASLACS
ncbi:hypothetical protein OC834_002342 [Tilletia horrida]|nr:hypothetical protein OC834_002342 [Tilletia horrida]